MIKTILVLTLMTSTPQSVHTYKAWSVDFPTIEACESERWSLSIDMAKQVEAAGNTVEYLDAKCITKETENHK